MESVDGEWSGDNLYPKVLEKLFKEYKDRLSFIGRLGSQDSQDRATDLILQSDINTMKEQIIDDIKFITGAW